MAKRLGYCQQEADDGSVCGRPLHSGGYCALHWSRRRSGSDLRAPISKWAKPITDCTVDGCEHPAYSKGLCSAHYQRMRDGRPLDGRVFRKGTPLAEKVEWLLARSTPDGECLIAGKLATNGYATGLHDDDGKSINGYRAVYKVKNGGLPKWAQVHHACGNRACIRPEHLVLASQKENVGEMHARSEYERRIAHLEELLMSRHCQGCSCSKDS